MFRWQKGRQNTGYDKMLIGGGLWPYPFDIYILKFSEGDISEHAVSKVLKGSRYVLSIGWVENP